MRQRGEVQALLWARNMNDIWGSRNPDDPDPREVMRRLLAPWGVTPESAGCTRWRFGGLRMAPELAEG